MLDMEEGKRERECGEGWWVVGGGGGVFEVDLVGASFQLFIMGYCFKKTKKIVVVKKKLRRLFL